MSQNLSFKVARIHKISSDGRMKAFVDMTINDSIIIRGLRIVSGTNGLFVSMPQEQGKDKKWYDTIKCLSQEVKDEISQCALEAYASQK